MMTVRELIEALEEITDQSMVVVDSEGMGITQIDICKDNWGEPYVEIG